MVKKVTYSNRARKEILETIAYLKQKWSNTSAERFVNLLYQKINNISDFPYSYKRFDLKPSVRQCKITKHLSIYYKIKRKEIEVITFFDSRQNPDRLKL